MPTLEPKTKTQLPNSFRPLLWYLDWNAVEPGKDKNDIIVNTINEGTLEQWKWVIKTYGEKNVRDVLRRRLDSEFHPESRKLAQLVFSIPEFRHAR